jgi:hypothetical membrane protein
MDRSQLTKWGSLAGIAGAVTFSLLWAVAIIADGHWLFGTETLSELGGLRPGSCFFNTGVMVMGIMSIPFGMAVYQQLTTNYLGRISAMIFIAAAILLIGVGVFPINTGTTHTFFSWGFFITIITAMTLMLHPYRSDRKLCRLGFATTLVVVLIGDVTILLVTLDLMELGLSEALIVMGLNIWVVITSILLLRTR